MDGAVYMRYRNLKIGSGPGNDVHLNQIGRCANVSENHAVIFYDDVCQYTISYVVDLCFI